MCRIQRHLPLQSGHLQTVFTGILVILHRRSELFQIFRLPVIPIPMLAPTPLNCSFGILINDMITGLANHHNIAKPTTQLGPDQTTCIGDSVTFNAGACSAAPGYGKTLERGLTVGIPKRTETDQAGTFDVRSLCQWMQRMIRSI